MTGRAKKRSETDRVLLVPFDIEHIHCFLIWPLTHDLRFSLGSLDVASWSSSTLAESTTCAVFTKHSPTSCEEFK